ncbi:uncharacterized protein LOC117327121 [Pecten maximus]|uniref:uncharacterized protein LOC117327121 n=1 Tax=Pecten maximus TaxID=6579 RepID=UPI001458E176|nr:uncharacterized protein LOC117327121 [Pecten maximus]
MARDENFLKMIEIAGEIFQGIAYESVPGVLDENIAFVTFGHSTSIWKHLTNDQSCWIDELDSIKGNGPDGPSDLCKGLGMCRDAIKVNKNPLEAYNRCISARIVLITNGNISDSSEQPESFKNREKARHQAYSLVEELTHGNHKVFCVPLCSYDSPRYRFLEKLAHQGSGCIVRPDDIQHITRYHRKILWALRVESCHPGVYISEGTFITEILKGSKLPFTDGEVEDMMEIVANSDRLGYSRASDKTGRFEDPYDDLPPLGTRVKQGEHWREDVFKEHHCGPGTGTVIGQEAGSVWVEWDGCEDLKHYKYKYGLNKYYEVRVHDRPRTPEEGKPFMVGCCITRIEWEEDEPDDPLGYGLVFITNPYFETFGVRWKNGDASYYKYNFVCCVQEELPSPWCFGPE